MRKITAVLTVLLLSTISVFSQQKVSGKVTDASGAPLVGISVKVKGSNVGTSTGPDGSFSVDAAKANPTLEFSGIGFENKSVKANGGNVTVSLSTDTKSMSEVVVTGVGTATSKRKIAIDVASMSTKNFAKSSVASIEQGLMGQIAGAQIQQTSGQPNQGYNIILRGVNTLGGTSPMILLDGIEISDLSVIDPNSVDRIEVVKGAAGGMLYGAQGANGVIQIFSKKGLKGKMRVTASTKFGWDNVLRGDDLIATKHHYQTNADGYIIDNAGEKIAPSAVGEWTDPIPLDFSVDKTLKNDIPYKEKTYDHISQSFRQAFLQNYSVGISGGVDNFDYAFNVNALRQQDVYSNIYKKNNFSLNMGVEIVKGLTLRSITQVVVNDDNLLTSANSRFGMLNSYAYIDFLARDANGKLIMKNRNENQHNPLSEQEWHTNYNLGSSFIQNGELNYKLPKFVTLNYKIGYTRTRTYLIDYYKDQTSSLQTDLPWGNSIYGSMGNYAHTSKLINSIASAFINTDFQKDFHSNLPIKTSTQVAYDYRHDNLEFEGSRADGIINYSGTTKSNNPEVFGYSTKPGTFVSFGYLVNQSIDYGNLFGITGGFRSDYSSEFGAASKPFTFYRYGGYFRPVDLMKSSTVADWKIRATYGEAGTQPDKFDRQLTLASALLGNSSAPSLPTGARNPNLQVQVSKETEIGTDISLRSSRKTWLTKATFSATYWKRKGLDIIQNADVAPSTGFLTTKNNLMSIDSKGLDLSLDFTVAEFPKLKWNMGYKMGFMKSTVAKIAGGKDVVAAPFSLSQGHDLGELYGQYVLTSMDQTRPDGSRYIEAGDKGGYTMVNGYVVDTSTYQPIISDVTDKKSFGSVYPKFNASLTNTFVYKNNLTISFQFDWFQGNKIYNASKQWLYRDQWSKDFDQPVTINGNTGAFVAYHAAFYNTVAPVNYFVEDGSFVRLRNASISYDFAPVIKANKNWFKSIELVLAGRNLLTFSKYTGLDPENTTSVDVQGNDVGDQVGGFKGVDYFGVPNTRSFQVGLNLVF